MVVATNQSGMARGLFEMATLNAIHDKMHKAVAQAGGRIDAVFYCPHSADMDCDCRKPKPGMFDEIAARYGAICKACPPSAIPCATCRQQPAWGRNRFWSKPARAKKPWRQAGCLRIPRCSPI